MKRRIPCDFDGVFHTLMHRTTLRMKAQSAFSGLTILFPHCKLVVDVNGFDPDRFADTGDAAVHRRFEGIAIKSDLTPCQGATQCAVHSAAGCGNDMVERRGDRRSFFSSVILAERSLDAINDRLGYLAKKCVAVAITILQACV